MGPRTVPPTHADVEICVEIYIHLETYTDIYIPTHIDLDVHPPLPLNIYLGP